jgi:hypothetical protein
MTITSNARLSDDWPPTLLTFIGQIVIAAGQLEHVLDLSYKRFAQRDYSEGMQDAADLHRVKQKTARIKEAAQSRGLSRSDMDRLEEILNKMEMAWEERNDVIHAVYAEVRMGRPVRRRRVSQKGQPFQSLDLGVDEQTFATLVTAIRTIRNELNSFTSRWI